MRKKSTVLRADLMALRAGEVTFDRFAVKHEKLFRAIVKPWGRSHVGGRDVDDLYQEALLTVWRAVDSWDPERGVPIDMHVKRQIRYRLLVCCSLQRSRSALDRVLLQADDEAEYGSLDSRADSRVARGKFEVSTDPSKVFDARSALRVLLCSDDERVSRVAFDVSCGRLDPRLGDNKSERRSIRRAVSIEIAKLEE